jgi:aminoglycoside phosphotransferase (APT) family kinase protein
VIEEEARAWVERETGNRVVATRSFTAATSSSVDAVEFDDGTRLVLRRYTRRQFLVIEPDAPRREVDVLRFAQKEGLPVPEVIAACDGEVPMLLMTLVEGQPDPDPDLDQLAELASRIHAIDASGLGHDYFRWYEGVAVVPPQATDVGLWEAAIATWHERMPAYAPVLIHRDFHQGNVLWEQGSVSGIVDWVNACRGPAQCDIAHARNNLGPERGERFTRAYEHITDTTFDPYWDIASVLEHDADEWTDPANLREAEERLRLALGRR